MLPLYTLTIFASAYLLFLVQPLAAKVLLPVLGGTPAVWNTAMVFFQLALLAGYAYAHAIVTFLGVRRAALLHVPVALGAMLLLPISSDVAAPPTGHTAPAVWLIATLAAMVGGPFFVLASTSSLLQRWFAASGHRAGDDPYWLYAASNVGSLLALLSYPLVVEPGLSLSQQSTSWSLAYAAFAALMSGCALAIAFRTRAPGAETPRHADATTPRAPVEVPTPWRTRLRWIALAAIPSSLMLGVTQHITTDIAAVPLLWVIPLAFYLLTFILAFSTLLPRIPVRPRYADAALLTITIALTAEFLANAVAYSRIAAALHLVAFFALALHVHTNLAQARPPARKVTEFFLFVSIGGALGGVLTAIVAPLVFDEIYEYPLAIALALACRRRLSERTPSAPRLAGAGAVALAVLTAMVLPTIANVVRADAQAPLFARALQPIGAVLVLALLVVFARRPLAFAAITLVALLGARATLGSSLGPTAHQVRTFFGVHKVIDVRASAAHAFLHGVTLHGQQYADRPLEPTLYFRPEGPLGSALAALRGSPLRTSIAVTGLGVGTIAAYTEAGETITYYEIDPVVVDIAEDTRFFTYLSDARARGVTVNHVVGDARLRMEEAAPDSFGIIVVDAFTSDAIPVHLLTVEAIELYLDKLAPAGIVFANISNRHVDMAPIFAANARELGVHMRYAVHVVENTEADLRRDDAIRPISSAWIALAREPAHFERALAAFPWRDPSDPGEALPDVRPWSDNYSNLISAIRWTGTHIAGPGPADE